MADMPSVTLRFSDGIERAFPVAPGQSVLDAALAAQAPVFYQCRSGSCASCLARFESGDAPMQAGRASVLTAGEVALGLRLLCCTEARGDAVLSLDYNSAVAAGGPVKGHAFVNAVERIADDAMRLSLELADGFWFDFRPGQFIQLKVPGTDQWRSYSIASTAAELPVVELLIRLLPGGCMSTWLTGNAKADDWIEVEGPFGSFFLQDKVRSPHIMIAGGTGLAPMMAMIDTIRARSGPKPRVLLSFGCATPQGLFHRDELELRAHWLPGLDVRINVDRGEPEPGVRLGNPVAAVAADDITDPETVAYLCGPPGLIAAARDHLASLGVRPENIHAEQFVASQ